MVAVTYNSNTNLKASNVKHNWTAEQVSEYIKCSQDPIYFMENFCKIISLDHGLIYFKLYDCQKEKVKVIHENRKVVIMESRQNGKCFSESTTYTLRNKKTGEVINISAGEFHKNISNPD